MAELADRTNGGATSTAATKPADVNGAAAKGKKDKPKKEPKQKQSQEPKVKQPPGKKKAEDVDEKGITTLKEQDLSMWYQEILLKGDFLEYSDIPGCYIINVRA